MSPQFIETQPTAAGCLAWREWRTVGSFVGRVRAWDVKILQTNVEIREEIEILNGLNAAFHVFETIRRRFTDSAPSIRLEGFP